jgi:nucleoside-diphosphate kinase
MSNVLPSYTLALLKPELVAFPHVCWSCARTILEHFDILHARRFAFTADTAVAFYGEHQARFFFARLTRHIQTGPVVALVLRHRRDAHTSIEQWRASLGPTRVFASAHLPRTDLRAHYALSDTRNTGHGSDSALSLARELHIVFGEELHTLPLDQHVDAAQLRDLIFGDRRHYEDGDDFTIDNTLPKLREK